MKKKIKDLTFFDLNEICLKAQRCDNCPLYFSNEYSPRCLIGYLDHTLPDEWAEILEKEVEI